jgi:hypothetical protein
MVAAGLVLGHGAVAAAQKAPFDRPAAVEQLPPDADGIQVACTYFSDFMLREVFDGPASEDALLVAGAHPPCGRQSPGGGVILRTADHALVGRKGPFLVFSALDPNGAVPFIVIAAASGHVVLRDATAADPARQFDGVSVAGGRLHLAYRRAINAPCSLLQDAEGCWQTLADVGAIPPQLAGKPPSPELCRQSYQAAHATIDDPSILLYPTEVLIGADGKVEAKVTGAVSCEPLP